MYAQLLNLQLSWEGSPVADTGHDTNRKWQASGACGACKPTRVKSKRFHSTPPLILCPPPAPGFPPYSLLVLPVVYLVSAFFMHCACCLFSQGRGRRQRERAEQEEVVLGAIARHPCRSLWAFSASSGASCPSCPSSSSCCSWAPSKVTADAAYTPVNLQCLEDNYSTVIRVYGL